MTSIVQPALVISIITLALTFLLIGTYFINFVSQKNNFPENQKDLRSRINVKSLFEQAVITCTIVALYGGSMTLFFILINWEAAR